MCSPKMKAFRIIKSQLQDTAFSGQGARRFGGRWNSKGTAVVYTAGSIALAALELLVRLSDHTILEDYVYLEVEFSPNQVHRLPIETLPENWDLSPPPPATRAIGDNWVRSQGSLVLEIPSVVIPTEKNYLINPEHPLVGTLRIHPPHPFAFDKRLIPQMQ